MWSQMGQDRSGVHVRPEHPTSVNVVLMRPDGERCFLTNPHAGVFTGSECRYFATRPFVSWRQSSSAAAS